MAHLRAETLRAAVDEAAHCLPMQGPIHTFVHHNTLHAFQHLPFHEALAEAARRFDTESYLPESAYRECLARGRIRTQDLEASYDAWHQSHASRSPAPPASLAGRPAVTRRTVHWALLHEELDVRVGDPLGAQLAEWHLTEGRQGAPATLAACRRLEGLLAQLSHTELGLDRQQPRQRTHRDLLREQAGDDPALLVNALLVPLSGAYLDQGTSPWPLAGRSHGFFQAFVQLMKVRGAPTPAWAQGLRQRLQLLESVCAEEAAVQALAELGVPPEDDPWYVERVLLELPGWAGMFRRLEVHPEEVAGAPIAPRLVDYLAVRLTLTALAVRAVAARKLGFEGPLQELPETLERARAARPGEAAFARRIHAYRLLQLAPRAGYEPMELSVEDAATLLRWLNEFGDTERRRVWHEAYESFHRDEVLTALVANLERPQAPERRPPRYQVAFCIDDREESLRRHLEETAPDVQTLGIAGFFGLAMEWRGLDDARYGVSCPVAVRPAHRVAEVPRSGHAAAAERRRRRRALWGGFERWLYRGTRSWGGSVWAPALGLLSGVPLLANVLFPRVAAQVSRGLQAALLPRPDTALTALRPADGAEPEPSQEDAVEGHGFTVEESVVRVAATLENLGLVRDFAPLIVLLGHGAQSQNNPHASAYDCGACGGRHGGPHARLFAQLANEPSVRAGLAARGIHVPEGTWFVGGQHDTTSDAIEWYDVERLPPGHQALCQELRRKLDVARALNAHERCRRFASAPRGVDPRAALRHVERRARALDEPRPELGHATNAVCVVGRRALTRGLFLDRRAFLVEYDPAVDVSGSVLERILAAVGPVGAGINLEYYFSRVDNDRFGCGSKLAHNLTAGIGVMDGAESDLRTGLPWQMVELHEPVRLLLIVESTPERVLAIAARQPEVAELVTRGWIRLCCLQDGENGVDVQVYDPERGFEAYEPCSLEVPCAPDSAACYRDRSDFVPPTLLGRRAGPSAARFSRTASRGAVHAEF